MSLTKMVGMILGIGLLLGMGRLALYAQDETPVEEIRYFHQVIYDNLDGIDGLDGVQSLVMTPDGAHLYAVGFYDDSLLFYSREAESGKLTQIEILRRDNLDSAGRMVRDMDGPGALILSPDGRFLYTANQFSNGISIFARDLISGRVTFVESLRNGGTDEAGNNLSGLGTTYDLRISADGRFLYATGRNDDAIVIFARNVENGKLTLINVIEDGKPDSNGTPVDGLDGATYLTLSPDGRFLYVVSLYESGLVTFQRNPDSGQLTFVEQIRGQQVEGVRYLAGLSEPHAPLISPDGRKLFVPARGSNQLLIFDRNSADGKITFTSALQDKNTDSSGQLITGLRGANFAIFDPNGALYVAGYGDSAIVRFKEDESGQWLFAGKLESQKLAVAGGTFFDTMSTPTSFVIAPDNRFLYAAGFSSDSIAIFGAQALPGSVAKVEPGWRNLWGIIAVAQPSETSAEAQIAEVPLVDWITPVALVIGGILCLGIWSLLWKRAQP